MQFLVTLDHWVTHDSMQRVVIAKGEVLGSGQWQYNRRYGVHLSIYVILARFTKLRASKQRFVHSQGVQDAQPSVQGLPPLLFHFLTTAKTKKGHREKLCTYDQEVQKISSTVHA